MTDRQKTQVSSVGTTLSGSLRVQATILSFDISTEYVKRKILSGQSIKVLASYPDTSSVSPRGTHGSRESVFTSCPLTSTNALWHRSPAPTMNRK